MKKIIRLTESDLHNIINETVENILDNFELPDEWYRTDARDRAFADISKDDDYRSTISVLNAPVSTINDDGETISSNDISNLRGKNKYNNAKRREKALGRTDRLYPYRPRKR